MKYIHQGLDQVIEPQDDTLMPCLPEFPHELACARKGSSVTLEGLTQPRLRQSRNKMASTSERDTTSPDETFPVPVFWTGSAGAGRPAYLYSTSRTTALPRKWKDVRHCRRVVPSSFRFSHGDGAVQMAGLVDSQPQLGMRMGYM